MATLDRHQVEAVARLCRLSLREEEIALFRDQLSSILSYVEKLNEVPTDSVEPTNQVTEQTNAVRPDVVQEQPDAARDQLLAAAPEREGDGWKVKTILKES